ncbi:hypothetical protein EFW05_09575 [Yersinia enterocolitica]|nr:hypothetical protein [Yersinia enterocolitica]EKN4934848.1 hypothetical protein [Yersinia enterocolitica]EKN5042878.1 hypothetical protein [Yersinia enterocolitica]EKN5051058.1 hypothetical protein [Yersinia enterocolitica]EKN5066844.1 hypothetical protein [Yersinia enterocolitica]
MSVILSGTIYIRHTSSCMCVGRAQSPESLTSVNSSGFTRLPPSCNSNYLEYNKQKIGAKRCVFSGLITAHFGGLTYESHAA